MAWDLSGLTAYVEQCNVPLLRQTVFNESPVIDQLPNWVTGIKTCADIGLLGVDVTLGDCACGFSDGTDADITPRQICVACIQIMGELCDLDLAEYFTGKYIRRTAGEENIEEELYREFIEAWLANIRLKTDILTFQGDTDSSDPNLNKFDGFLKIIEEETPASNKFAVTTGNATTAMMLLAKRITRNMRARGEIVAFVDPQIQYSLAMSAFIACPCQPGQTYESYTTLPNGLRLIPAEGLRDTGAVIITPIQNFIVGTDFANDREKFKFWFSDDDQVWRYIIKFYLGVQIAFPEEVIFAALSQGVLDSLSSGQTDVNIISPLADNGGVLTGDTAAAREAVATYGVEAIQAQILGLQTALVEAKGERAKKPGAKKPGRPSGKTESGIPGESEA